MPKPSEHVYNGMKLIDALYQSYKDGDINKEERIDIVTEMEEFLVSGNIISLQDGLFDWSEDPERTIGDVYSTIRHAESKVLAK